MKKTIKIGMMVLTLLMAASGSLRAQEDVLKDQEFSYYYYAALQALHSSHYDDGLAYLLHCYELRPEDAAVCHYLSVMYGGFNDQERTLRFAELAYRYCPTEYWQYLVTLYQQGEQRKALKEMKRVASLAPDDSEVLETLQNMYGAAGDYKHALAMQDRIDKAVGSTAYGAMQRYTYLTNMGKRKKAEAAIRDYLKEDPSNYYFQVFLGDTYARNGAGEAAMQQYRKVIREYPENPYLSVSMANWHWRYGSRDSSAYYGRQLVDNENIDLGYKMNVLKENKWLTQIEGAEEGALLSLCRQYPQEEACVLALAQYYVDHQQPDKSVQMLWTVLDINPKNDKAWQTILSFYQSDSTTTDEAYETLIRKALQYRPQQKQWYYLMSIVEMRKEETDSAICYCKQGLACPAEKDMRYQFSLYVQLGDLYMHRKEADSTYHYYELALSIDPDNAYVLNNYAYFLAINGGDLRKAEKMSSRSLKSQPNSATFLDTYAWILHLQGQELLARFYMQQAWENAEDKSDPELIEHYQTILR